MNKLNSTGVTASEVNQLAQKDIMPFEAWLRTVCFQPPTQEAYDLAKSAWEQQQRMIDACEFSIKSLLKLLPKAPGPSSPPNTRHIHKQTG